MRFAQLALLALPAVAVAEEQIPLLDKVMGFFNKAQSVVSSAMPAVPSPADAGASKVADAVVARLDLDNWKSVLVPSSAAAVKGEPEPWMVYINGGNKTCFGACGNATKAWNQSVALLSSKPNHPGFATIDCEEVPVLCGAWSVGPPSIYYFLIPQPLADQTRIATEAHYILLNRTAVTSTEITELYTKSKYKETPAYEGVWHPFDGQMAQLGLDVPLAYIMYYVGKMPSWLPMILISFFSRSIMSKRMQQPQRGGAAPAAAQ